jgi:hypothetical protein
VSAPRSARRSAARLPAGALALALLAACAAHPTSAQAAGAPAGAPPPALRASTADASTRWVCRGPARVFDTPGGIVIAILARGDRVTMLPRAADSSRWVLVHGPIGIRGWVEGGVLCG